MGHAIIDIIALNLVRLLVWSLRVLPRPLKLLKARSLILVLRIFMPRISGVGKRNLELVFPEKSEVERKKILDESFEVLAKHLIHFAQLVDLTPEKAAELFDMEGLTSVIRENKSGTGVLIPTMHYGSFEWLAAATGLQGYPISFLARGFNLPRLDKWWNDRREACGNTVFARTGGYKEITTRLKKGEDVSLLFDQNVKINHTVFTEHFGMQVATSRALALAAMRTKCKVVFVSAAQPKVDGEPFEVTCEKIPNPNDFPGTKDQQIHDFTLALNKCVERSVKARPEQWFWIHRRFKTRPEGEPSRY